jgi:hypothetical protein
VSKVVHRARALIVAPDVKPSSTAHIKPVRMLQAVLRCAALNSVPVVFALSRRGIGQVGLLFEDGVGLVAGRPPARLGLRAPLRRGCALPAWLGSTACLPTVRLSTPGCTSRCRLGCIRSVPFLASPCLGPQPHLPDPAAPPCRAPQVFGRDKSMSIVAVMNTEGCHPQFMQMLEHAAQVRAACLGLRASWS